MLTAEPHPTLLGPYALTTLIFAYDALEPMIDEATMRLHHQHHHRAHVDIVNAALARHPQWQSLTIEDLLHRLPELPDDIRADVRFHGGGHANHQFFWKILTPNAPDLAEGVLSAAIDRSFGSFDAFRTRFKAAGLALGGAGWVWLVARPKQDFRLDILTLSNNDSLLEFTEPAPGLLICDFWEHAYYLRYHYRRSDWLQAWWRLVNWPNVGERLLGVHAGHKQL